MLEWSWVLEMQTEYLSSNKLLSFIMVPALPELGTYHHLCHSSHSGGSLVAVRLDFLPG